MISMVIDLEKERDKWRSKANMREEKIKHLERCIKSLEWDLTSSQRRARILKDQIKGMERDDIFDT